MVRSIFAKRNLKITAMQNFENLAVLGLKDYGATKLACENIGMHENDEKYA
jgi:hypothetical protein